MNTTSTREPDGDRDATELDCLRAVAIIARYYRAEQESGDVHLDSAAALWNDLCLALDALAKKQAPDRQ
jgi:hypothetical protein